MATIIAFLSSLSPIIGLAVQIIDAFAANNAADDATKQAIQQVAQFAQANGVKQATATYTAEAEIAEGDKMWTDQENAAKAPPTTKT